MSTANSVKSSEATVELTPSYALPLVLILLAIPLLLLQPWLSLVIALFGLFLLTQAATIRLQFTDNQLDVYRSQKLIRQFPYAEWKNWRIFWPSLPILFYFREVKSIHFLPVLFNPKTLKACLEMHIPLDNVSES